MFEYVDMYMSTKVKSLRYVVLNVYGGESLHHPAVVEILQAIHQRYQQYKSSWHLTVTTTTNAIISQRKLSKIIPLVDEFTVSYHVENSEKNKQMFRDNLLDIKQAGRRLKCVVLMHPEPELFNDCNRMIQWLTLHQIKCLPRQLDNSIEKPEFNYNTHQVVWFNQLYSTKGNHQPVVVESELTDLSDIGRACCGGRSLCVDQNYKKKTFFVPGNNFSGWFCSVNHFFLYIKQVNGEIFTNKDCKMNFDGDVAPIGHLSNTKLLLDQTRNWIDSDLLPVIQCKKSRCLCGLCAPKAHSLDEYNKIIPKYFKK